MSDSLQPSLRNESSYLGLVEPLDSQGLASQVRLAFGAAKEVGGALQIYS